MAQCLRITTGAMRGLESEATRGPIVIVWGRNDRVCFPSQAELALARFPGARLQWLDACGHFPQWDRPRATTQVILASAG